MEELRKYLTAPNPTDRVLGNYPVFHFQNVYSMFWWCFGWFLRNEGGVLRYGNLFGFGSIAVLSTLSLGFEYQHGDYDRAHKLGMTSGSLLVLLPRLRITVARRFVSNNTCALVGGSFAGYHAMLYVRRCILAREFCDGEEVDG